MFDKHKSGKQTPPVTQEPRVSPPATEKAPRPAASASQVAMIGQGISIAGDVTADSNLKIEGRIEGRCVQSSQDVEVAESGAVVASIIARVVKISGEVTGDVGGSEKVFIARSGKVQGNIVAPRVQLEDGALFRGSIDMNPVQPAEAAKPEAKSAPAPKKDKPAAVKPASERKEPGLNLKSG